MGKGFEEWLNNFLARATLYSIKGGEIVSLNPARSREIIEFIDRAGN